MQNQSLDCFFSQVDELTQTHLNQDEVPTVVVMGPYNTGKSTLINCLLGQYLSPVDIIPTTPAPVRFSYGEHFLALLHYPDRQMHVLTPGELTRLLTRKERLGHEITHVEVRYKHELLKKMHIVDTPGLDALHEPSSLLSRIPVADHIVYLLQQRGLNEADRQHIQKLLSSYNPGNISFWLNCNLGDHDGTALEESRQYLRQICAGEVTVHMTNTIHPDDVNKFITYIENRAALCKLQKISGKLNKLDLQINDQITTAMRENDDAEFLVKLWPAVEQARLILDGEYKLNTLPPVTQEIAALLTKPTGRSADRSNVTVVYKTAGPQRDPAVIKGKFISLIKQALADPSLLSDAECIKQLKQLHSQLHQENFLVTTAGGFSSGKSTFLNALMGEAILPAQNRPTTAAITLLKHGSQKKATINYARQITIPTHYLEDKQAVLCRHELEALEQWISDPILPGQISAIDKSKNGNLTKITAKELLQQLELLKKFFARVKRDFPNKKRRPWKSLFKKIAATKFLASDLADYFVVHFKNAAQQELELESAAGRAELNKLTASHLALRVADIVIEHPAEPLRLATFVDTPGLDSVYHHHREITNRYLPASDCFLFFLNGKHILTQPDMSIWTMLRAAMQDKKQPGSKLFVIVNFADTLTGKERNKVYHYLQDNLIKPSQGAVNQGSLFFISALQALNGADQTNFSRLLGSLKERIWELRCAEHYPEYIQAFKQALPSAVQPTVKPEDTRAEQQLALLKIETGTLLKAIKERLNYWQAHIAAFSSLDDFYGLREGQKSMKGWLGLSRKTVTVPSCRDLAESVNALLKDYQRKWISQADNLTVSHLNLAELQKTIDQLMADFNLSRAHSVLNKYLKVQEAHISSSIKTLAGQIEQHLTLNISIKKSYHLSPAALTAAQRYLQHINKLEASIYGTSQQG
ncbi:Bacterial dynamin-like protein [Sporotomaculum syntrophicum]|uniref:Bacterial dynamin-like protein n=1 Tax=Sporotomaculum syntrophicum TaxID=182264 RepID=A0A9D2WNJ6_9FIRM|nr:dynamin family protein [Sporotomaculum syntrophicum]KAF1084473.1 Bacterial dynamin-like protein [Sporotomaculum syntrophicum]